MHCAKSSNFAYKNNKIKLFELMKRICVIHYLSLFLLALCSHVPSAAQSDTAVMRISYDAKFKTCVERPEMQDEMELLIGNKWSKFYSSANIRQQHVLDSVVQATGGQLQQALAASTRMRGSGTLGQKYMVMKNYPADGKLTYTLSLHGFALKSEEDMPAFDWQLADGDSIIAEYHCNKARTKFRGQTWTVWYAPDIAVSDGPWKLCGLPGLIMKAETDNGCFSFVCTAVRKGRGESITMEKTKYKSVEPKELQKITEMEITDPVVLMTRLTGLAPSVSKGRTKQRKVTPVLIEDNDCE